MTCMCVCPAFTFPRDSVWDEATYEMQGAYAVVYYLRIRYKSKKYAMCITN